MSYKHAMYTREHEVPGKAMARNRVVDYMARHCTDILSLAGPSPDAFADRLFAKSSGRIYRLSFIEKDKVTFSTAFAALRDRFGNRRFGGLTESVWEFGMSEVSLSYDSLQRVTHEGQAGRHAFFDGFDLDFCGTCTYANAALAHSTAVRLSASRRVAPKDADLVLNVGVICSRVSELTPGDKEYAEQSCRKLGTRSKTYFARVFAIRRMMNMAERKRVGSGYVWRPVLASGYYNAVGAPVLQLLLRRTARSKTESYEVRDLDFELFD